MICREELTTTREGQPTVEEIVSVTLKECRKENIAYKMEALQCTAAILNLYDIDHMKDIANVLLPLLPRVCLTFSTFISRSINQSVNFYSGLSSTVVSLTTYIMYVDLHWLDVPERVTYKLVTMVHNCLHAKAPQ